MKSLEELRFDPTYQALPEAFYQRVTPEPVPEPYLVSFNADAAALIGLDPAEAQRPEFAAYFAGNRLLPGSEPIALCYAGHQFGTYVPQLGDGRAILIGEVRTDDGAKWDLQLKGAGRTRFSRGGDGRAVLRSSIREYLCSEAMHGLGIPTTRALCIIGSDMEVYREAIESAAIVTRMAPSHVRFGTFEHFAHIGRTDMVGWLADHVIEHHFPALAGRPDRCEALFNEVVTRTARLMAQWQLVGFAHGVMNTDNMSILGLTLDYGPFGFLDDYDPAFICNHSDHRGRYAFGQQPKIGLWNLVCLAEALLCVMDEQAARDALDRYEPAFAQAYTEGMLAKLGLRQPRDGDDALIRDWLALLAAEGADYTNSFRALGEVAAVGSGTAALRDRFVDRAAFDAWAARYVARLQAEGGADAERRAAMDAVNPKYVLRNYLAHNAIASATRERDFTEVDRLLAVLRDPFAEHPGMEHYAAPPPDWGKRIAVSCSS